MTEEIVYIHKVEGTNVWIPVKARQLSEHQYEILNHPEFEDSDEIHCFDNHPGEIVTLKEHTFSNGKVGKVVGKLIRRQEHR
jgi:phage terminase large subunit-like protein